MSDHRTGERYESLRRRLSMTQSEFARRVTDPDDVGTISLPARLDWSPRMASGWDYADEVHRREISRIVFDVGDALDIQVFTDPTNCCSGRATWTLAAVCSRPSTAWSSGSPPCRAVPDALNRSQRRIVVDVMSIVASNGFVMAGGVALIVAGVSSRPTHGLDAFQQHATTWRRLPIV